LSGQISLADFEDWFVPTLWEIEDEDEQTRELVGRVHIVISEFSRGDRSLEDLHKGLAGTIRTSDENRCGETSQRVESYADIIRVAA
jgi:hypothetical protein